MANDVRVMDVHRVIETICPIFGVSLGNRKDRATWRIDFKPEATAAQRKKAQALLLSHKFEPEISEDVGAPRVIR